MNLYEINSAIENFAFEVDEESGEVLNAAALDALNMERNEKLENIACWIKNLGAEAKAIRDEEKALADRRKSAENRAERLKRYLESALRGEKFETARCKVSYRKSASVETDDSFLAWAREYAPDLLRRKDPEPDKTAIKTAILNGVAVGGARLVETVKMTIN